MNISILFEQCLIIMNTIVNKFLLKLYSKLPYFSRMLYLRKCEKISDKENGKIILLSFDCDNLEDISALKKMKGFLDDNKIKITFAVPGEILLADKTTFLEFFKEGHEFIGHGFKRHSNIIDGRYVSTLYYNRITDKELEFDIMEGNKAIKETIGKKPVGFRIPHFGHSNSKNELLRVYNVLVKEGIEYSSSTLPFFGIKRGPIYKSFYNIKELPVSGRFDKPLSVLDTYSFGFSKNSNKENYKDYLLNVKKYVDYHSKKGCGFLNLYCDPSQAVQMKEWFEAIKYIKDSGYRFLTLNDFVSLNKKYE